MSSCTYTCSLLRFNSLVPVKASLKSSFLPSWDSFLPEVHRSPYSWGSLQYPSGSLPLYQHGQCSWQESLLMLKTGVPSSETPQGACMTNTWQPAFICLHRWSALLGMEPLCRGSQNAAPRRGSESRLRGLVPRHGPGTGTDWLGWEATKRMQSCTKCHHVQSTAPRRGHLLSSVEGLGSDTILVNMS